MKSAFTLTDNNSWSCGPLTGTHAVLSLPPCGWYYEQLAAYGSKIKKYVISCSCHSSEWRREGKKKKSSDCSHVFCSRISSQALTVLAVTVTFTGWPGFHANHPPTTKKKSSSSHEAHQPPARRVTKRCG